MSWVNALAFRQVCVQRERKREMEARNIGRYKVRKGDRGWRQRATENDSTSYPNRRERQRKTALHINKQKALATHYLSFIFTNTCAVYLQILTLCTYICMVCFFCFFQAARLGLRMNCVCICVCVCVYSISPLHFLSNNLCSAFFKTILLDHSPRYTNFFNSRQK